MPEFRPGGVILEADGNLGNQKFLDKNDLFDLILGASNPL